MSASGLTVLGVVGPKRGKHEDYLYHSYLQKRFDVGNNAEEDIIEHFRH